MTIEKLEEFASNGDKHLTGLDVTTGFPRADKPERPWFNKLFGDITGKINEVVDSIDELPPFEGGVLADTFLTVENTINQRQVNKGFSSIFELIQINNPKTGLKVDVNSYHLNKNCGGGTFMWDATISTALHNGGTIISLSAVLPIDWDNQEQVEAWLYPVGLSGTGCWVRQGTGGDNIQVFGALPDGINRVNLILERMTDLGIAIYAPKGIYRVEDFTRKLRGAGNLNQKSMRIFGDLTFGSTDQNYAWGATTVFQGNGDMFKHVVNMRLDNLLFRNTPSGTLGKILTLGAYSQCEISNCTFGPSNYHVYNAGKGMTGYNVKPSFRNCRFYGAKEWSRFFEGVIANYREENCYTSTNRRGMYMACPMTASIESCVYEYNELGAIELDAYGYTTTYGLNLKDVFFETNGAGVPASEDKSLPQITIRSTKGAGTTPTADAAKINFKQENCYYTDTSPGAKAESAIFIDSKTTSIVEIQCWIEGTISTQLDMYSGSLTAKVDFEIQYADGKNILIRIGKGIKTPDLQVGRENKLISKSGNTVLTVGSQAIVSASRAVLAAGASATIVLSEANAEINGDVFVNLGVVRGKYRLVGNSGISLNVTEVAKEGSSVGVADFTVTKAAYPQGGVIVKNTGNAGKFLYVTYSGIIAE